MRSPFNFGKTLTFDLKGIQEGKSVDFFSKLRPIFLLFHQLTYEKLP